MDMNVKDYATLQTAVEKLCEMLTAQGLTQENVFDCKLVAYELLGNVLKHGGETGALRAELKESFVEMRVVSDKVFDLPKQITCSGLLAESGRGLFLVNTICEGQIHSDESGITVKIRIKK